MSAEPRVHRAEVRDGVALAWWRAGEGRGGYPLLLVHGFPETKRIWRRNLLPLAAAGFDVIAPDLRGVGDSDPAPDDAYDPPAFARDLHALVHDVLGIEECGTVSGDVGGAVAMDLSLRFPGFVSRQCIFNTLPPVLPELYAAAGIPEDPPRESLAQYDYFLRQGTDGPGLLAELSTPALRRGYVEGFYGHRLLAGESAFAAADRAYMAEPFGEAARLRAAMAVYEIGFGRRALSEPPRLMEVSPVPTLVLYGPEDRVVDARFMDRMALAFPHRVGPFVVPGSGHFVQWEAPRVLHSTLVAFFRDLLPA